MITNKQLLESWNTYNISNIEAFKLDEIQYVLFADETGDIQSLFDQLNLDIDQLQASNVPVINRYLNEVDELIKDSMKLIRSFIIQNLFQDTPTEAAKDNMEQLVLAIREIYHVMMTKLLDVKSILDGDAVAV
jgi:dGTP triphosphohydrolase